MIKCLEEQSAQAEGQQAPEAADLLSRFAYRIPERQPYPGILATIRRNIFVGFVLLVFLGTGAWLTADAVRVVLWIDADPQANFRWLIEQGKLFSVPLVCLLFTWFHVWLALLMMFYPINFYGCPRRPIVPEWLDLPINGWQGIVPRKVCNYYIYIYIYMCT